MIALRHRSHFAMVLKFLLCSAAKSLLLYTNSYLNVSLHCTAYRCS